MGKKKGSKKKSGKKGDKGTPKKKKGPTRCGPDFKWERRSLLVEAIDQNDVLRCKKLVARGEDINEALHYAIGRGRLEIVSVFMQAGADLHTAVKTGDYFQPAPGETIGGGGGGKKSKKKSGKKSGKKKKKK
mmetsp:Transcript_33089/g.86527  ORF Transcript_33089/g.86527 Transcript_33089/m.86527 type:complete len:132 (+) Transcript_33089:95-490(+)